MRRLLFLALLVGFATITAKAQDPAKADPKHFKVEIDNAQVRVLRYTLAPGEKTAAHEHARPHVEVQLTDSKEKTTIVGGQGTVSQNKAGRVEWEGIVGKHSNENVGDTPVETIVIELRNL